MNPFILILDNNIKLLLMSKMLMYFLESTLKLYSFISIVFFTILLRFRFLKIVDCNYSNYLQRTKIVFNFVKLYKLQYN